ncbi:M67 family metallopeptidase [Amycolatopsis sp. cmx-4-61]|uniref:M67 family metallopeptidase n=1 Tax=Amycolatopsis sp. cmx-4-61 TaxID=2790937 RepID=UPI00397B9889
MIVEALNYGLVLRYEWRNGQAKINTFARPYDPGRTSLGHTWLPINIQLDPAGRRLFCSFSGFRPRLLPRHIAGAYPGRVVELDTIRHVPPLLMRLDAATLEPDSDGGRGHLSYAEPIAMIVAGDGAAASGHDYVCTFSPEIGLRIYDADDLGHMLCHAEAPQLALAGRPLPPRPRPPGFRAKVTVLTLTRALYEQLIQHAREAIPAEAVGLLGDTTTTARIAIPLPNVTDPVAGSRTFLADPRAQFLAERRLRATGLRIIAIYHSHPGGGPVLSAADQALAARWPTVLQVVIAVARPAGRPDEIRAYHASRPPVEVGIILLDG